MRPIFLAVPVVVGLCACTPSIHDGNATPTPTPSATPTATPTPNPGAHLTANATWNTAQTLPASLTIDPGVTLTITSSASVAVAPGNRIYIQGTLLVNGAAASKVVFDSSSPATPWSGIQLQSGGVATARSLTIRNASAGVVVDAGALLSRWIDITLDGVPTPFSTYADVKICRAQVINQSGSSSINAGTATFVDSEFLDGAGDTLVFSQTGNLVLDHGHESGNDTGWHCLTHGGGPNSSITVTNSILEKANYGFMLNSIASGRGTVHGNRIAITHDPMNDHNPANPGPGQVVDASNNYWGSATCVVAADDATGGVPSTWTVAPCVTSATDPLVVNAGPRAAGAGCESDTSF